MEEDPKEDPKEVARRMLIDGYQRDDINEETQKVTGLPLKAIWGIKGSLVRSGHIPTRAELAKAKREKPGPEALKFKEEMEEVPFRRPRPPHVLIESILTQFGVKERAKDFIIKRCKRAGEMRPSELERSLIDLDSGVNRKKIRYITEEYYLALRAEEDVARQAEGRSWPIRRLEPVYSDDIYPRRVEPSVSQYEWGYDRSLRRRPWERSYYIRERSLTRDELMDILLTLLKYLR